MLDSTSRRVPSSTAASAVSASAADMALVSTMASGSKSATAPRRWGRSRRSAWRWSARPAPPSSSCSPRWTSSSSWPWACSSSVIAAPTNRVPPSTITRIPPAPWSMSEPQARQLPGVALPLLGDLDVQVEVDVGAEQRLQLRPRPGADLAQHGAAAAEHDRLLAGPLHEQGRADHQQVLSVGVRAHLVDQHRHRVGQLVADHGQGLLADQLGDQVLLGLVADVALRVQRPALGKL